MAYVLITVTGGGKVGAARFETLYACQQARSIALFGMTMEDKAAADTARTENERQWREAWYAAHPPREPKEKWEISLVKHRGSIGGSSSHHATADGLIQDDPPSGFMSGGYNPEKGEWIDYASGYPVTKYATDIKTAICVAETPETAEGLRSIT